MNRHGVKRSRVVVSVGPLPPPLHGASIVHDLVLGLLRQECEQVRVVDTSAAGRVGARYHLIRAVMHLRAAGVLLRAGGAGRQVGVYLTGAGGAGIWYQVPLALISRLFGYSLVYHHHSFAYLDTGAAAMRCLVAAAEPSTCHVALCEDMRARLVQRYPGIRSSAVCSNSAFVGLTSRGKSRPSAEIRLGHLGNLNADKGLGVVLSAHARARAAGHATHLHLAGPLADESAESALRAAERRDGATITYHGPLARAQVAGFLQGIDVFLFPSRYRNEAEPLVVLEALRAGVPVLAFGVGCLSAAFRGTRWLASDEADYHTRLQQLLAQLGGLGPSSRQKLLRAAAVELNAGFGTADRAVILAGLGLRDRDADSAPTTTERRWSHPV